MPNKKTLTDLTPAIIDAMQPTQYGGGYLWDKECEILQIAKMTADNGKGRWSVIYSNGGAGTRVVVNGAARTREHLGMYPDMSIEEARRIAKSRAELMFQQRENPVTAPLLRSRRSDKNKKRPVMVKPEAILDEVKSISPEEADRYEKLMGVLMDAYSQASAGKGDERHSDGQPFEDQDMMRIMDRVGADFALGQVIKKCVESRRLTRDARRKELLGAIVYLAGAIVWHDMGGKA